MDTPQVIYVCKTIIYIIVCKYIDCTNILGLNNLLTDVEEYCVRETLEARCKQNEVIMMQHALYGRMKIGRCVAEDMGKHRNNIFFTNGHTE